MMRSHGTDIPREIYQFGKKGEPIYDAIEKAINLRYSLLPYIYATAWQVTKTQSSFMRALVMDFPSDKKVWNMNNEYMFGKSILVAPIVNAQYTPEVVLKTNENTGWNKDTISVEKKKSVDFTESKSTSVYLPKGASWYNFWTNENYDGGQELKLKTEIDKIPLFIKAGTIMPFGPKVQYSTQKEWNNLEIRVFEGADGEFTLYEDEFDNYNYEKAMYSTIKFIWNNTKKELTIANREGSFPSMLSQRKFNIIIIGKKTSLDKPELQSQKTIDYNGGKIVVKL